MFPFVPVNGSPTFLHVLNIHTCKRMETYVLDLLFKVLFLW